MKAKTAQQTKPWGRIVNLVNRLRRRSLNPILTPEQLNTELIRATVVAMIKIGIPFQFLVSLSIARSVWVLYEYKPSVFITHILSVVIIYTVGMIFVIRDQPNYALLGMIITSMLEIYIQIVTTRNPALFGVVLPVLALPAVVLPRARMFHFTIAFTIGFLILIALFPFLRTSDWPSAPILTWSILIGFMTLGTGIQGVLREYAATKDAHEEEAIKRALTEEQNRFLIQHNNRLLFAQHDLRGPCNTVLGTIEVLQLPSLDSETRQSLVSQLEPTTLQLRSRIDALFDQAKTPLLSLQAELPVINLGETVQRHLPELRRMVALMGHRETTVSFEGQRQDAMIPIRGRVGEIQRILENLVLNAAGVGATSISISVLEMEDEVTRLTIKDNGPGFPETMLLRPPQLMLSHREHGTGLGLAGVFANVQAFGGKIRLSNTSVGAHVIIDFPRLMSHQC